MKQLTWLTPYQPPECDEHDGSIDAIMSRVPSGSQQPFSPSTQQAQVSRIAVPRDTQSPQESHLNAPLRPSTTSPSGGSDQARSPLPGVQGLLEVSRCQDTINTPGHEPLLGTGQSHAQALAPCASTCPLEKFALSYRLSNGAPCHNHGSLETPPNMLALGVNPTNQSRALPSNSQNASYKPRGPPNTSAITPHIVQFHHHALRNPSGKVQAGGRPGQATSNPIETTSGLPDSAKGQNGFGRNQQRYILPQSMSFYSPPESGIPSQTIPEGDAYRTSYHVPDQHHQPRVAAHSSPLESNRTTKSLQSGMMKASHNQNMAMDEKLSRTIPLINVEIIPPSSPNKRERHLEIAQRSRQRRKERENPLTGSLKRHNFREHGLAMHLDHYRSERNFFRDLVNENHIPFPPRPPSPSLVWHCRNGAAVTSAVPAPILMRHSGSKGPGTKSADEEQNECEVSAVTAIATASPGPFPVQPGSITAPHAALQQDTTAPVLSEYFSRPIKRESMEVEDENQMEF